METYLANIIMFGGSFAIHGWAECAGQQISISQNQALYSIIGTSYGGDGRVTMGLPDFRGRSPIAYGQGPGLSNYFLGQKHGNEDLTLTRSQMPAHTHDAVFTPTSGGTTTATLEGYDKGAERSTPNAGDYISGASATVFGVGNAFGAAKVPLAGLTVDTAPVTGTVTVANTGGNQPVNIMNPYQAVSFQIAMVGIYPSRN